MPLAIQTTTLPNYLVGDPVEVEIELSGGCGGPYVLQLLSGELPDGVDLDDAVIDLGGGNALNRHHLAGVLLEVGQFDFTLVVTDVGCSPSTSASRRYAWLTSGLEIDVGTLPAVNSSDDVDLEIPLQGGCGGPYEIELISGQMPWGIRLDDGVITHPGGGIEHRHHLSGVPCEDGVFVFTLEVVDLGCPSQPQAGATLQWTVSQGPVRITNALDGDDAEVLIPEDEFDEPTKWLDIDALAPVVQYEAVVIHLVACGGTPPYTVVVVDDPLDPDDDAELPLGMAMAINASSMIGTPLELGPNGRPFRITFRVQDAVGTTSQRKLQWLIEPGSLPTGHRMR